MNLGLPGECSACGDALEVAARFCVSCGRPVAASLPPPTSRALDAERERRSSAREPEQPSEAELKQVTVLFADIEGSVALAEQVGAEEWHRVISAIFGILANSARRYGGTVSRFTGDGMMALFGAPRALEDHAARACHAALHARAALLQHAVELRRTQGVSFSVRMGLDSGPVVVSWLPEGGNGTHTAIGQAVVVAERMERLAEPGRICLTEGTRALVGGFFEVKDLGTFRPSGSAERLRAFELCGEGAQRSRLDFARSRGLSRFVGRRSEMDVLERALERTAEGQGRVVEVVGDAGVGKSRLCHEFVSECRRRGHVVLEWHGFALLSGMPYLSFIEDLRKVLDLDPRSSEEEARQRIDDVMRQIDPGIEPHLGALHDLLGVASSGRATAADPGSQAHVLGSLVERVTLALSRLGPAVVLVEDAQWLDRGSARLVESVRWLLSSARILLLLTFRPGHRPLRPPGGSMETIALRSLPAEDAEGLVSGLLGGHASTTVLKELILDRAAGNPFFIEEMVWSLADAGVLDGERGRFRLLHPVDRVPLPGTLKATLDARIDQLPAEQKRVLQAAAVIGPEFDAELLRQVVPSDSSRLGIALAALTRGGFIDRSEAEAGDRYRFCHPLMHEEAYFSQIEDARARTHALVAKGLAELDPDMDDSRASLIGHHWENAGEPLQAARWSSRAARWIAPRRTTESLRAWRRVRELSTGLHGDEVAGLRVEACVAILELGSRVGSSIAELEAIFEEGERLARERGDLPALARLLVGLGQVLAFAGECLAAIDLFRHAYEIAKPSADRDFAREIGAALAWGHFSAGNFRDAVRIVEELLVPWPGDVRASLDLARGRDIWMMVIHAMAIVDMGRIDQARRELELAAEAAQRHGAIEALVLAWSFAPVVAQIAGDDGEIALSRAERAVELSESLESPVMSLLARWGLGVAHLLREDWGEASRVLGDVLGQTRELGFGLQGEAGMLAHLADASLGMGDLAAAEAFAREAVEAARRRGTAFFGCVARLGLARVLLASGDAGHLPEVDECIAIAAETVDAEGLVSLRPVLLLLGSMRLLASGDGRAALGSLREAERTFEAIGATGHAARLRAMFPAESIA